ncbi:uncharacterized protein LOC104428156 [Eucalyptus grandis]|uniref:Uncharacterized protein ycf33 n=2 Tax=Eucalyptus grandis TaxID=71139 RepID=A0A059CFF4_EUCGR|nr:uncharacterized protein LOC104428156 [Eucalyptus grandis]KAK3433560.1 hypothetical protein EUGRSUZ_D01445 [Eucalyptus grandis]
MKTLVLQSQFLLSRNTNLSNPRSNAATVIPSRIVTSCSQHHPPPPPPSSSASASSRCNSIARPTRAIQKSHNQHSHHVSTDGGSRKVVLGAVSLGIALLLMGFEDHHNKALAFGPEGPLAEEFWENVRRYALYALTVSTGAIYTILQPILELLKNPISAVLILLILGGSTFIVYQVVATMVGVNEFAYDYAY